MQPNRFLSPNQKHLIGIYGGVGPLAHIEFEKQLLAENFSRGARKDQDHPVWIVANASSTPDRTTSLLHKTHESLPAMIYFAQLLENAGADALFVICNTAHGYHRQVQEKIKIPWIHLMNLVAKDVKKTYPAVKSVGILGTDATMELGLYHTALEKYGITPIAPQIGTPLQQNLMEAIYHKDFGIKATGDTVSKQAVDNLVSAAAWCRSQGAEAIIAGCTEISVGLTEQNFPDIPIIDPLRIAAKAALDISFEIQKPDEFVIDYS